MLTVSEAAKRLHRNPETVRRWIRDGKLFARKIGTQHVIEESDLEPFLELNRPTIKLPSDWGRTWTGEPMPDWVAAVRRARAEN